MKSLKFYKATGQGNDYIVIEDFEGFELTPHFVKSMCDRHRGVGGDGVILFEKKDKIFARIFNSDGSEAEISGNGIRCLASVLHFSGVGEKILKIETLHGVRDVVLKDVESDLEYIFEMNLGKVNKIEDVVVFLEGKKIWINGIYVELANPHFVIFKKDFNKEELFSLGPLIEKNSLFKRGVNVEFAKVLSEKEIFSYFWERGVGYTLSSGTGAAASAIATIERFHLKSEITVYTEGGDYLVRDVDGEIIQRGQAKVLYKGEYYYL